MKNFLKEGDVIKLEKGMKVHTRIPEKFVYESSKFSDKLTNKVVTVGEFLISKPDISRDVQMLTNAIVQSFDSKLGFILNPAVAEDFILKNIPAPKSYSFVLSEGEFVVVKTAMEGGGTGHGAGDTYPDGHHVFCKRLNADGSYDDKGTEVNFYQSGCFTGTILPKDIEVLRIQPTKLVSITVEKFA